MHLLKIIVLSLVGFCGTALAWGTGVIISNDGYILTDSHVITDNGYTVKPLSVVINGKYMAGSVVTFNTYYDLALIKINYINLPCLSISKDDVVSGEVYSLVQYDQYKYYDKSLEYGNYINTNKINVILTTIKARAVRHISQPADDKWVGKHLFNDFYSLYNRPGNSGSPIVDVYGSIVGLDQTGYTPNHYLGAVSNVLINQFVPNNVRCINPSRKLIDTEVMIDHG